MSMIDKDEQELTKTLQHYESLSKPAIEVENELQGYLDKNWDNLKLGNVKDKFAEIVKKQSGLDSSQRKTLEEVGFKGFLKPLGFLNIDDGALSQTMTGLALNDIRDNSKQETYVYQINYFQAWFQFSFLIWKY